MSLKRTMTYLDSEDHRALFERAFKESRVSGQHVTMAELIRCAVKVYLQATPGKVRRKPSG